MELPKLSDGGEAGQDFARASRGTSRERNVEMCRWLGGDATGADAREEERRRRRGHERAAANT